MSHHGDERRLAVAVSLVGLVLLWGCSAAGHEATPPNFVFILIDDLGWADVGSYGSTFYETPHVDRLASQGMLFTNAYAAAPICSPTRASLLTGRYPATLNVTDWIPGRRQWEWARLLVPEFNQQLPLAEISIADALRESGYVSASIGKWHLGGGIPRSNPAGIRSEFRWDPQGVTTVLFLPL